jgi:dTMP kinase
VPLAELDRLEVVATGGLRPDRTILLDVPVELGLARKSPADQTRFETGFDLAFHRRVRNGFLAMAVAEPSRFVVLDARADADEVARRVLRAVEPILGLAADGPSDEPNRPDLRIHR